MKFSRGKPKLLIIADDFYDYSVAEVVSSFCVVLLIASEGKKRSFLYNSNIGNSEKEG